MGRDGSFVMQIFIIGIDRSIIIQNCWDRMEYTKVAFLMLLEACRYTMEWSVFGGNGLPHVTRKLPLSVGLDQWVGSAKTAGLIEMPFRGLTNAGWRNSALVGWAAHWRHLVNMIESSAEPAKRQQRVQVRQCVHVQQCLSLCLLLMQLNVTLNFSPIKQPLQCGLSSKFCDHLL